MIEAKNLKLGRMLYTAGLYRIDDFATSFNALAAALQIVRLLITGRLCADSALPSL